MSENWARAVSLKAPDDYRQALKLVAARHRITVAELVKKALDESVFRAEIDQARAFFAGNDSSKSQLADEKSNDF